jgi:hemolysin III
MLHYGEKLNSFSHLFGAILAMIGSTMLILIASKLGDPWKISSFSVYGATLLALYVCSTLYHSIQGASKEILQKFDHCAIYLLIAGTYTPFALVSLRSTWGWPLFGVVWGLALVGIVQEIWLAGTARRWSLVIYVLMGWLALTVVMPLITALGWYGFAWLAAGGILYTGGIVFYVADTKIRHGHGVWHLFVLGGSICHYFAVYFYVA